jgi:flagellum-specific ATP synthase
VEADDINDPIGDTVRGIVDGHIVLSRKLADAAHYPAIEILGSISRLMSTVSSKDHIEAARNIKELYAIYQDAKDLIDVGAYKKSSNPKIDKAIEHIDEINDFLTQFTDEKISYNETLEIMKDLNNKIKS